METKIIEILGSESDSERVKQAAAVLSSGEAVAIPTETVYGLAANAFDPEAVKKIFAAKGRPQDNPLIVHVHSFEQVSDICKNIPDMATLLTERFWPGPLTLILQKKPIVPDAVSAGLKTVAVRCPSHPAAQAILRALPFPLAAPSANLSGKPSTTRLSHVIEDLSGKIPLIVDGGDCDVGLESTILDLTVSPPTLLRPGSISAAQLSSVIGEIAFPEKVSDEEATPKAPGMKYRHYAPSVPLSVYCGSPALTADKIAETAGADNGVICFSEYVPMFGSHPRTFSIGSRFDSKAHAEKLFDALRTLDRAGVSSICCQCPAAKGSDTAVCNRLKKAAGGSRFHLPFSLVVGLTGRSGSGKSSIARVFSSLGAEWVDCDAVYHTLTNEDTALKETLIRHFGPVYRDDDTLDRKALGRIVFSDPGALAALNRITNRFMTAKMSALIDAAERKKAPIILLDAPTLFETGTAVLCHKTAAVLSDPERMAQRIVTRDGVSLAYAKSRIAAQPDDDYFREHADIVIENLGTAEELTHKAEALYRRLLRESEDLVI